MTSRQQLQPLVRESGLPTTLRRNSSCLWGGGSLYTRATGAVPDGLRHANCRLGRRAHARRIVCWAVDRLMKHQSVHGRVASWPVLGEDYRPLDWLKRVRMSFLGWLYSCGRRVRLLEDGRNIESVPTGPVTSDSTVEALGSVPETVPFARWP